MTRNTIRWVTGLGLLAIVALLSTQAYWLVRALSLSERQFSQNVHMALKETARDLRAFNGTPGPLIDPVDQLSDNYYVVMVNDVIDANVLEHYLTRHLKARDVREDFEYGVYDCNNEQLAYGNYVSLALGLPGNEPEPTDLPRLDKDNYYFGVLFPNKGTSVTGQSAFIVGSALLTLLVVGFFGYALLIISRQRRLSEVQRDFINNMTHEFKTPLSTIAISAKVLQGPEDPAGVERRRNYAGIIGEEADRLLAQIDRVLQMARADRGTETLRLETLDLARVVEDTVEQHRPVLEAQGAQVQLALEPGVAVEADRLHLTSMLHNLLDNALKYGPAQPELTLRVVRAGRWAQVSVTDNGPGLAPAHQRRIFDKFYRVPTGNLHDVKGFGLGLTYVRRMMARHGGRVTVDSSPGQGSTFTLHFQA